MCWTKGRWCLFYCHSLHIFCILYIAFLVSYCTLLEISIHVYYTTQTINTFLFQTFNLKKIQKKNIIYTQNLQLLLIVHRQTFARAPSSSYSSTDKTDRTSYKRPDSPLYCRSWLQIAILYWPKSRHSLRNAAPNPTWDVPLRTVPRRFERTADIQSYGRSLQGLWIGRGSSLFQGATNNKNKNRNRHNLNYTWGSHWIL